MKKTKTKAQQNMSPLRWIYTAISIIVLFSCIVMTLASSTNLTSKLVSEEYGFQLEFEPAPLYTKPSSEAKVAVKQNKYKRPKLEKIQTKRRSDGMSMEIMEFSEKRYYNMKL